MGNVDCKLISYFPDVVMKYSKHSVQLITIQIRISIYEFRYECREMKKIKKKSKEKRRIYTILTHSSSFA